ncbi:MAG: hypothetical protein ACRDMZ_16750, partial [Solirubrobacteraceae bacterium]
MRRGLHSLGRVLAGLLALAVLICASVALITFAVSRGWQRERVRAFVETELSTRLKDAGVEGRVRIGVLEGPLYPDAMLRDLAVELSDTVPLHVRALHLRLDLAELVRRRLVIIDSLRIEGATLALTREPGGEWLWQRIASADGSAKPRPIALELRELAIEDSRIEIDDRGGAAPTRIDAALHGSLRDLVWPPEGEPSWPAGADLSVEVEPG